MTKGDADKMFDTKTYDLSKSNLETQKSSRILFPHQSEANESLSKVFSPIVPDIYKAGLLVLPTGAGKTFTSVYWILKNILPKNIKVLWLAQTSLLLDQAAETFDKNIQEIPPGRENVSIRVISSSEDHDYAKNISLTDDIVIITTQTAVLQFKPDDIKDDGTFVETALYKYIKNAAQDGLFIVLDEAHHAPAYGCRTLLKGIIDLVPNSYLLGLTATPIYNDKTRAGFLPEIFNQWIIYQVEDAKLIAQEILAKPEYEEMETGIEVQISDKEYENLVRLHRDIDERIISELSANVGRNDHIVQTYVNNKEKYGKTIIFADRWIQCEYLQRKLEDSGVRVNSVYTYIQKDPNSRGLRKDNTENQEVIRDFKAGKYDVLINVRMLTEGADIPDTQTIFVTRQTTSPILFTQMIGRGLRGKKAGGGAKKDHANIVLFIDEWKRLIDWVTRPPTGGVKDEPPVVRGYRPIEYIAIDLIKRLSDQIASGKVFNTEPFLRYIPVGWYMVNYSVAVQTPGISDELERFSEFVMVYEDERECFSSFITSVRANPSPDWSHEHVNDSIQKDILQYAEIFFNNLQSGERTKEGIIKVGRHIAQNGESPEYHDFGERFDYDLDKLVDKFINKSSPEKFQLLKHEFEKPSNLWEIFFKRLNIFKSAYDAAENRILFEQDNGGRLVNRVDETPDVAVPLDTMITPAERAQVIRRDGHCLCCGIKKKSNYYELDHIIPFTYGGQSNVDNLQTLCQYCNKVKGTDTINFRDIHRSKLSQPKSLDALIPKRICVNLKEDGENILKRLINFFYHCAAVSDIKISQRSNGSDYYVWKVELYQGNKVEWLLAEKERVIDYLHECGFNQVTDIEIVSCKN